MLQPIHEALRRGAPDHAIELTRKALAELPSNPDLHHLLSLALVQKGEIDAAEDAIQQALALAPQTARFHVAKAQLALARGDVDSARGGFGQATADNPNSLAAYLGLARIEFAAGRLDEAEAQLRLASRVSDDHPGLLLMRGQVALARGNADGALAAFNKAAGILPNDPVLQTCLGLAHLQRGFTDVGIQALRNALRLNPALLETHRLLVGVLIEIGDLVGARSELQQQLERSPDDAQSLGLLGRVEADLGQDREAVVTLMRSLALLPDQPEVLQALVALWSRGEQNAEIRAGLDGLLQRHPGSVLLWRTRYSLDATAPEGEVVLARWREAQPDSVDPDEIEAQRLEALGQQAAAEAFADRALGRDPQRIAAGVIKARAEFDLNPEAALARIEGLLQAPLNAGARRNMLSLRGLWLDRLQRPAEAFSAWMDSLQQPEGPAPNALRLPGFLPSGPALAADAPRGADARLLWVFPATPATAVVAALSDQAQFLVDRFSQNLRDDGLGPLRPRAQHHGPQGAEGVWRARLATLGLDASNVVDVLPHCDPEILSALPEARLLALIADPRDLLLSWLAFGSAQGWLIEPPQTLARWLLLACRVLHERLQAAPERTAILRVEDLETDAAPAMKAAVEFLGLSGEPEAYTGPQGPRNSRPQLPTGRWRAYAGELGEAFELLQPAAQALGYPD